VAGRSTAVVTCAAGRAGSNLGILPLDGPLPLAMGNSVNLTDDRLVVVEDWHAEPWLDDAETIALYRRGDSFAESAVFGADARQVIARVRWSIRV
jgi:CRP-like cAMP-binding protein